MQRLLQILLNTFVHVVISFMIMHIIFELCTCVYICIWKNLCYERDLNDKTNELGLESND